MAVNRTEEKETLSRPGVPRGGPGFMSGPVNGNAAQVEDERAKRADEIRRKQQELEVASEVEQKLLREAQRRQEEDARRFQQQQQLQQQQQQQLHQQQFHYKNHQQQASQRLDSLVGSPGSHEFSNGPVNGMRTNSIEQHNNNLVNNGNPIHPPPPERHSSYNVMQQQHQYPPSNYYNNNSNVNNSNGRLRNPSLESSPPSAAPVKRVQFSENSHTSVLNMSSSSAVSYDANANQEQGSPHKYNPDVSDRACSIFMSSLIWFVNFS